MANWQNGQHLEPGITLLEASAGTGKTFRIAHIVMRLLAEDEDMRMDQVAVLSFTRAATGELKDRIRRRMAETVRCLDDGERGQAARLQTDEVLRSYVAAMDVQTRHSARRRLQRAKRSFDEGLISTIHGFCQRLMTQNAFETGAAFGIELEASIDGLLQEIISDLFSAHVNQLVDEVDVQAWQRLGERQLLDLAKTAVGDFTLKTVPGLDDRVSVDSTNLVRFVAFVRREYDRRYRAQSKLAFEDLTRHFSDRLRSSETAHTMADALAGRFRAVLVDEFQDTDARQWSVFYELFGRARSIEKPYLFLIGDPKQAIYGFRGADIRVYGAAKEQADAVFSLDQNFRTDAALLHALNGIFGRHGGAADFFGLDYIRYSPCRPGLGAGPSDLVTEGDPAYTAPLNVRFLDEQSADDGLLEGGGDAHIGAFDQAHYVAVDIVRLLHQSKLRQGDDLVPLRPAHIAVLVRANWQGEKVAQALADLGVPASMTGQFSVWDSAAADGVIQWLQAISNPASISEAKAAAATPLFGWTARQFLRIDSDQNEKKRWARWCQRIREWRVLFDRRGFFAAFQAALTAEGVMSRLMAQPGADRMVTDLLHVVDLVHEVQTKQRLSLSALLRYVQSPGNTDAERDGALLRLERDDSAVRIMTMHASKGLEFPVVYLPYLFENSPSKAIYKRPHWTFPDPDDWQARRLELRDKSAPDVDGILTFDESNRRHERANLEEALRLLYVAMTRAKHRCVVYDASHKKLGQSALSFVFHRPGPDLPCGHAEQNRLDFTSAALDKGPPDAGALWADLMRWVDVLGRVDGRPVMGVRPCRPTDMVGIRPLPAMEAGHPLIRRVFERERSLERHWQRHSYSNLTRNAHGHTDDALEPAAVESPSALVPAPPLDMLTDRGIEPVHNSSAGEDPLLERVMPSMPPSLENDPIIILNRFPAGAEPGSCLHAILETVDFMPMGGASPTTDELAEHVAKNLQTYGISEARYGAEVIEGLTAAIRTPMRLPGCDPHLSLAHIPSSHRLNEWHFTLPLAGGQDYRAFGQKNCPIAEPIRRDAVVNAFRLGQGEGLLTKAYVDSLARLPFGVLAGFLVGSIDLVFSIERSDGQPLYFLADYKSNRLDLRRERVHPISHFHPTWMAHEMRHHHYVVQAHLYALALHRFLRLRLGENYNYETHFGGAAYLFLRGMIGPDTPQSDDGRTYGVYFEKPNQAVIDALDALFEQPTEAIQ